MTDQMLKDPNAVLDYTWDWAVPDSKGRTWLGADTITSKTVTSSDPAVTVGAGPTPPAPSHTTTTVTAWLSGGVDGTTVRVTCRITTATGRTDDRTLVLSIRSR